MASPDVRYLSAHQVGQRYGDVSDMWLTRQPTGRMRSRRSVIGTAHHEAAHAVAVCVLDCGDVVQVNIIGNNQLTGLCEWDGSHDDRWNSLVVALAGPAASKRVPVYKNALQMHRANGDDMRTALKIANDDLDLFFRAQDAAKQLVDKHWRAIEHVAGMLLKHKTLSGHRVHRVVSMFNGFPAPIEQSIIAKFAREADDATLEKYGLQRRR